MYVCVCFVSLFLTQTLCLTSVTMGGFGPYVIKEELTTLENCFEISKSILVSCLRRLEGDL